MSLSIRTAKPEDAELIEDLARRTWPDTFAAILSEAQIEYMLKMMYAPAVLRRQMNDGHVFLLIYRADEAIGYLGYEAPYRDGETLKIHKIYVLPEAQGTGAGGRLMRAVESAANYLCLRVLELNVNRYNRAIDFYLKCGFVTVATEDIDIGNGYLMEDFRMVKKLKL